MTKIELNEGQGAALREILEARDAGRARHLLTGYAGTGKTTLMQAVVRELKALKLAVAVTAPTHKAVQVLAGKLGEAGLGDVHTMTIHSLLGLKPAAGEGERSILKRGDKSRSAFYDVVVIDECSMIGSDLQGFIDNDLRRHFVLYVGDPAQLPPVGEVAAPCFSITSRSNLSAIVRQAAGNPILQAATKLREQQSGPVDWSWTEASESPPCGVYLASDDASAWMQGAFTSDEFKANNDAFRYIAYTNETVHRVNEQVRQWIYGHTDTPFVPGERVLCRKPVLNERGLPAFNTNEEATVTSISAGTHTLHFSKQKAAADRRALDAWEHHLPVWRVTLRGDGDEPLVVTCNLPFNRDDVKALDRRLVSEAKANKGRWYERFQFLEDVADLRSVYALTVHSSQGSTFDNVFLDVRDCSKLERSDPLQMQQLLYVAVTRPRYALVLVGAM